MLGIQLQESRLPDKMSVIEALDLYASFYPEPHDSAELLERLGLVEQRKTYFAKLSGGQKQRLSVALALIGNPRVAILDELTTGLDPAARREVWELLEDLRGTGVTLLLVSHFMEEAERLCDRVIVIDHGRIIAADTPEGLAASVQADQRMSFLPSVPFDLAVLRALPDVHSVDHRRRAGRRDRNRQRRQRGHHRLARAGHLGRQAAGRPAQPGRRVRGVDQRRRDAAVSSGGGDPMSALQLGGSRHLARLAGDQLARGPRDARQRGSAAAPQPRRRALDGRPAGRRRDRPRLDSRGAQAVRRASAG